MRKSICIVSFSPIARDARVLRQIEYLSCRYDLVVIGYGPPPPAWADSPGVRWRSVNETRHTQAVKLKGLANLALGKLRPSVYDRWYWSQCERTQALEEAVASNCDAFHANDWSALPVAAEAAKRRNARLVFDAHEYAPLEWEDRWRWRLFYPAAIEYLLRQYAPTIDASTTVSPLIAERYTREFGLKPVVVLNAPRYMDIPPREFDPGRVRLIHHGGAIPARRLEAMIQVLELSDQRYTLHFMLTSGDPSYVQRLERLAARLTPGRVTFHEPVAPKEVVRRISEYDMGFYLLTPSSYNNRVALPNKLFDFIAAGLAVCVGPSPAMAELVRQSGCGCVSPSFEPRDVAETLNSLDAGRLTAMQNASREAARQFNADKEMGKVLALYDQLLGR